MKTIKLSETNLTKLIARIVEEKGSEGHFMDYHKEGKIKRIYRQQQNLSCPIRTVERMFTFMKTNSVRLFSVKDI